MNRLLCRVCTLAGIVADFDIFSIVSSDISPVFAKEKIRALIRSRRTRPVAIHPKGVHPHLDLFEGMDGLPA